MRAKIRGIYFIILKKLEKALEKTFISKTLFETVKEKAKNQESRSPKCKNTEET